MNVAIHLAGPFEEAPEVAALGPQKFPEFEEADLRHLYARVSLNAPEKIRTAPGRNAMPSCGIPEKAHHRPHRETVYNPSRQLENEVSGLWYQVSGPSSQTNLIEDLCGFIRELRTKVL